MEDLQTIATEIKKEFTQRHDRLFAELQSFTTESAQREQQTLEEVRSIHTSIANMLEDSREAALERNEAIVKSTQRGIRWSVQSAKFVVGSVLLFALTLLIVGAIAYISPQDLLDQFRRWLPLIGAAWITYIGYLLYGIRPTSSNQAQIQDEQTATGQHSIDSRGSGDSP